jgi:RNA polymerase sigma factor (TIGR02999 family)
MSTPSRRVTQLLEQIGGGDPHAAEELLPLVYDEMRRLARWRLARETPGQTLQPTALVHEAYLRLVENPEMRWENRGHFFAAAAEAMRRILIERARRYARKKHGGEQQRIPLHEDLLGEQPRAEELLDLDRALEGLEAQDAAMADVVKLRYFAGLSVEETARALDVSPRSVNRLWTGARAWLQREMGRREEEPATEDEP